VHRYKITSVHELEEGDHINRAECCRWFEHVITATGEDLLDVTFLTDETWFHLSDYVNRQNSGICSWTTLYEIKDTPIYDGKVGMW
jgi:hypothetical protein